MTTARPVGTSQRLARLLPYSVLIPVAVVLGAAPFRPEPHVVEKLRMLWSSTLTRPIDIFDLALHGFPLVLVGVRVVIDVVERQRRAE